MAVVRTAGEAGANIFKGENNHFIFGEEPDYLYHLMSQIDLEALDKELATQKDSSKESGENNAPPPNEQLGKTPFDDEEGFDDMWKSGQWARLFD